MRLPWISREYHEAVMLERERLIVALRAEILRLEKRLETPIPVTVKLPDDFAILAPAFVRKRSKQDVKPENSLPPEESIKWAELNEENPEIIAKILARESAGRRLSPLELLQGTARIKRRIVQAKVNQTLRQMEVGTLDARISPSVKVTDPDIPADIVARIEAAERGE